MQLYICSTLRHLLFSLSRACVENQESHIVFLVDHQNIDESNLDFENLPEHITVSKVSRRHLANKVKHTLLGKLTYFLSMRELAAPVYIKNSLIDLIEKEVDTLKLHDVTALFVFNERNKTARLFRLIFEKYSIIEDGLLNYARRTLPLAKTIANYLNGNFSNKRIAGEDPNCIAIYAINPVGLPSEISDKGIKIDFLSHEKSLQVIHDTFKLESLPKQYVILATQPVIGYFERLSLPTNLHIEIYKKIISFYNKKGLEVIVKPHPQESKDDYIELSQQARIISEQTPLEAYVIGQKEKTEIISLFSSAGMGFEEYCARKTLIGDDEAKHINERLKLWHTSSDALDSVIIDKLS